MAPEEPATAAGRLREETALAIRRAGDGDEDTAGGILEVQPEGWGFLRRGDLSPIYVSPAQIRRFSLKAGDRVSGRVRAPKDSEKYWGLLHVDSIDGADLERARGAVREIRAG